MLSQRESRGILEGVVNCHKTISSFTDNCFRGIRTAEEVNIEVVDYCRPMKTITKGFFLDNLEKPTKEWPGVSHIIMKSNKRVSGDRPLMDI